MRWWISQHIVPIYKKLGILGWLRFRILRLAYKIFWWNSPRNGEWDYILQWLEPLRKFQGEVRVLDVGSTESLLIYELRHRGYEVQGIDQRSYQESNNHTFIVDILQPIPKYFGLYDYILAISTLEHVGLGAYGDNKDKRGDRLALENLWNILKDNGYFIITVPNKHLGTPSGRGYSYFDFKEWIKGLFDIVSFEERNNQICAVLVKKV